MFYFNLRRILDLRGIERPYTWLVANGFVPQTATRWAKNEIGCMRGEQIGRLCLLLNCTPNDLFEWRPNENNTVPDGHALYALKRDEPTKSFAQMTHDIPADKMEKLREMLEQLNTSSATSDVDDV